MFKMLLFAPLPPPPPPPEILTSEHSFSWTLHRLLIHTHFSNLLNILCIINNIVLLFFIKTGTVKWNLEILSCSGNPPQL